MIFQTDTVLQYYSMHFEKKLCIAKITFLNIVWEYSLAISEETYYLSFIFSTRFYPYV